MWAKGAAPTFDSPDIYTYRPSEDRTHVVLLDQVVARVRNLSPRVAASGTLVHCYTSIFGIGMRRDELSSRILHVPAGGQETVTFALTQAQRSQEQRLGVHIVLSHPHDENPENNQGSQTVHGLYTSEAGRELRVEFPVANAASNLRSIRLDVMSNSLHASVTPATRSFDGGEEITAELAITVPDGIHGARNSVVREEVTVLALLADDTLLDGLTVVVLVDE